MPVFVPVIENALIVTFPVLVAARCSLSPEPAAVNEAGFGVAASVQLS